jgi:hypothetical protein
LVDLAAALRVLQFLETHGVSVAWDGTAITFRPPHPVADGVVEALASMMRPGPDGRSILDAAWERHTPLLNSIRATRPSDVLNDPWRHTIDGLRIFLLSGLGDEAERLGWPHDELYRVPELWSQIYLCGVGLLIGDSAVTEVTPTRIRIKTVSGATQSFYRKPAVDYGLVYRERIRAAGEDRRKEEVQLRAVEAVVNLYRSHHPDADVDTAKAAVLAAIERSSSSPGVLAR